MWARPEDLATINRYIDGIRRVALEVQCQTINMDVEYIGSKSFGM